MPVPYASHYNDPHHGYSSEHILNMTKEQRGSLEDREVEYKDRHADAER